MKKMSGMIALLVILSSNTYAKKQHDGYHYTGIEYTNSELKGVEEEDVEDYSLILAQGRLNFLNYPEDYEGFLKYDIRADNHDMLDTIGYRSIGGRYQYNGLGSRGAVLGVKGALDYDNFYESYDDYFSRTIIEGEYPKKTGKIKDEDDFGAKFYGDFFKKIGNKVTIGFWNEAVVGKEEISDPFPIITPEGVRIIRSDDLGTYDNTAFSLQITPKLIYQDMWRDDLRFVFEAYMENRKYFKKKFEVAGAEEDMYYKFVINPQLILQGEVGPFKYFNYLAFENEKFQYIGYWQHILKTSPSITYEKDKLSLGFKGGGYDFEDEIGIVFDNNELLAFKKSDSYSAWIVSPKVFIEYEALENIYVGHETNYRRGEWTSDELGEEFAETSYMFYSRYEKEINDDMRFIFKLSYERYQYDTNVTEEKRLPEEGIYRVALGIKAKF